MFDAIEISFSYYRNGKLNKLRIAGNFSNIDLDVQLKVEKTANQQKLQLTILPQAEIEILELSLKLKHDFAADERIFVNGYQSWTDSREFFLDEKLKTISRLAKPLLKKYQFDKYGDYSFKQYARKAGEFHGYTYTYLRNGHSLKLLGSLSEKQGFTIISQSVKKSEISIEKECKNLCIDSEYLAFQLVLLEGSENFVFDQYFSLMGIAKPAVLPMTGWTSWYNYYQAINEKIILENLHQLSTYKKKIDIFQIDDGYQSFVGDWLEIDQQKFPQGMKYLADSIKAKGYKAGIWLAPFVCETNSRIFREKQHWILKDVKGELVLAGGNWSRFYALDLENPEVKNYLREVFSVILNQWGYDLVKLDFLYAVCLIPNGKKTRGQIMTEAMDFLRACVGDKLILACGVPLGASFGRVDYCRIGCDVGLDWDDKAYMRLMHRERVSTKNAIGNAIGRRQLNGRAFLNDPDVFFLRDNNMQLTKTQKTTLAKINQLFGSLIFTSDEIQTYDAEKQQMFDLIMQSQQKKVTQVEIYRDGLVEVFYMQDEIEHLVLINLNSKKHDYQQASRSLVITLQPYESREIILEEKW